MESLEILNVPQVLKELGLKRDDKGWTKAIKPTLIKRYGMRRLEGAGYRIPRRNLENFLSTEFAKHNQ